MILKWYQRAKVFFHKNKNFDCYDVPDLRDFIAGSPKIKNLPNQVDQLRKSLILGQQFAWQTRNECTAFARIYSAKINNSIEHNEAVVISEEEQWKEQLKTGARVDHGDSLQNALKQFHKHHQGFPDDSYKRVKPTRETPEQQLWNAKAWLARGRTLYTGVYWTGEAWRNLKATGVYKKGQGKVAGGHAVVIVGYDENKKAFKVFNSLSIRFGREPLGVFWIPFSEMQNLFSIYVPQSLKDKLN